MGVLASFCIGKSTLVAGTVSSFPEVKDLPVISGLPDPLRKGDDAPVSDPSQWPARRDEMKAILEHYALGHAPAPPGNVRGRILNSQPVLDGKAFYKLVRLTFGPRRRLHLEAALYLPLGKGPFPVFFWPSFSTTPGGHPGQSLAGPRPAHSPEEGAETTALALQRGYAVLTFDYQQAAEDRPNNRSTGFFPAYPHHDWSTIAAWAWGVSRCIDFLETQPSIDKNRIAVIGHSRLGKTALVAGAFDERIALTAACGSGCGGTSAYRFTGPSRGGKEGLEHLTSAFNWYIPRLGEFSDQVDKLPFDENWLIDLVAPRSLLSEDGLDDPNVNVQGAVKSYLASQPVYVFLGAKNKLGVYFRPGGHALGPDDWQIVLDFADESCEENRFHADLIMFPRLTGYREGVLFGKRNHFSCSCNNEEPSTS